MRRRSFWWALGLVLAGMAGIGWYASRDAAKAAPASPPARAPAPAVVATLAAESDVPIYMAGLGAAQAFNTVTLRARVDGQLEKVSFTEGQEVKAGDVIAQIDARPFQAALAQAQATKARDEAQLANAKRDLERFTNLLQREFATKQSVDNQATLVTQLEAALRGDQAAIDNAKVQLGYTTIAAPISGKTGMRLVDQGNMVRANDASGLVVITQIHPISVVFTLPQDTLPEVTAAMAKAALKVLVFKRDDATLLGEGALALVDNQIDQATGTVRLKATFDNANDALWPGEFVNARLLLSIRRGAVTVPAPVVQRGPNGTFAYVIKADMTVEQRPIEVGPVRDGVALIDRGLSAGERVVVDGQYKLRPGMRVDPGPLEAAKPASVRSPAGASS
ncbi:MAG: efflux RND transporter periplasmic adaptor subunit [Proteobacteria bacterium]|nr:efflux RND transporter periplasmic adaptor subunit [Pseudomonadota bacterium]